MILVIDSGNSRMKWGLHEAGSWLAQGAVSNQELATLALRDWQNLQRPSRVVGVNVAGEAARVRVEGQIARWRLPVEWLVPAASAAGVTNRYTKPSQLGADRWACLVAARKRIMAGNTIPPPPCLVVSAGTAVTVDALDSEGVFRGGLILPGLQLMLHSLAERTAGLKVTPGVFDDFPRNTPDALYSGAMHAICGAIQLVRLNLDREGSAVKCFVTGGAAQEVAPHLGRPIEVVDNLVLEGILVLAG